MPGFMAVLYKQSVRPEEYYTVFPLISLQTSQVASFLASDLLVISRHLQCFREKVNNSSTCKHHVTVGRKTSDDGSLLQQVKIVRSRNG